MDLSAETPRRSVRSIDWKTWTPSVTATLLFYVVRGQALLIRKKRGLGAGKVNAPGGRVESGESLEAAAVREMREELQVEVLPEHVRHRGELSFQFTDGLAMKCHVFRTELAKGEPKETDEAVPLWTPLEAIPYDELWADDRLWLPRMLAGWTFSGRFVFDEDRLLDHELDLHDPAKELFALFEELGIEAHTVSHPPVFTVAQAQAHRVDARGVHVKNLFVKNRKDKMFLLTVPEDEPVELDALGKRLEAGKLSFCSPDRLYKYLRVEPGAVTPLAACMDTSKSVQVVLAGTLTTAPLVHCHPLTNDRTTALSGPDLLRFLERVEHLPILLM